MAHTIGVPVDVWPVAPSVEQNEPARTAPLGAGAGVVAGAGADVALVVAGVWTTGWSDVCGAGVVGTVVATVGASVGGGVVVGAAVVVAASVVVVAGTVVATVVAPVVVVVAGTATVVGIVGAGAFFGPDAATPIAPMARNAATPPAAHFVLRVQRLDGSAVGELKLDGNAAGSTLGDGRGAASGGALAGMAGVNVAGGMSAGSGIDNASGSPAATPLSEMCAVHCWPSKYLCCARRHGSACHPAADMSAPPERSLRDAPYEPWMTRSLVHAYQFVDGSLAWASVRGRAGGGGEAKPGGRLLSERAAPIVLAVVDRCRSRLRDSSKVPIAGARPVHWAFSVEVANTMPREGRKAETER